MATGFVQRFKGKIECDSLWIKGQNFAGIDSSPAAGSTLTSNINTLINSSSAATVYNLPPPVIGVNREIVIGSVSSGVKLKAAAGTNFGVTAAGSTIIVLGSTVISSVELLGVSSVQWGIIGYWSTSTSGGNMTFSTTT